MQRGSGDLAGRTLHPKIRRGAFAEVNFSAQARGGPVLGDKERA
eukprot:CAMPEP_0180139542 /NCGR_PEP_ID=MMETSP0986-20121125/13602_1 /TAXON_ID=697907 /ORGANISM="non described non described, Strain CCMP2293" /LENGTH=43 /DNA_ID= /DNA_START= /DNA_END= /DNA_ORIENTATION=